MGIHGGTVREQSFEITGKVQIFGILTQTLGVPNVSRHCSKSAVHMRFLTSTNQM